MTPDTFTPAALSVTEFKIHTRQRTRTLTSGVKQVRKKYILAYRVSGQGWYEYPSPFTERAQAVNLGRAMAAGEVLPPC